MQSSELALRVHAKSCPIQLNLYCSTSKYLTGSYLLCLAVSVLPQGPCEV